MVVMKNALFKDTSREMRRTFSRFISIFAIVALGVSFFAGIKATCPDMKITSDKYFDDYRLMDIRLVSTIGFNDDDINTVKNAAGIEGIMPTFSMEAMTNVNGKDLVLKVLALPIDKIDSPDESYINRTKLVDGRYPLNPWECVAEKGKIINSGMSIGSKIKLTSGRDKDIDENLNVSEFNIVGIVETPYYISFERGASSIGNGKINSFIMIPKDDFKIPAYTDIFLTVKGAREVLSYDKSYDNIIEPMKNALEDTANERTDARYNGILTDANEKLNSSKKELTDAEAKQASELGDAAQKLEYSRKQIVDGEQELADKEDKFSSTLSDAEDRIADGYRKLADAEKEYSLDLQAFNDAKTQAEPELTAGQQKIDEAGKEIDKNEAQLNQLKMALALGQYTSPAQKLAMEGQIKTGEQQLSYAKSQLAAYNTELESKKKSLSDIETELFNARSALDDSRQQLEAESRKLQYSKKNAQSQFESSRKELDNSREALAKAEQDYENAKKESDDKISDARTKIADAEEKISKLEKPVWYVLDRGTNPGFVDYGKGADRVDAIAQVFPVFFFLVAALVCLTTMTRMVDEQRTYIGTLKALGYSKISIASKYLLYAAAASLSGSVFGVLIGFRVFPTVIFNAYEIMYTLPPVITEFNTFYAAISTAFAVLATTTAAWVACYNELAETPALLMRPKAPKIGKRVFLERIGFIWSRLNFTRKITMRNLLRYKRRFFMTVFGIGGCTALLLSGFGLKDSIMSIVTKQFNELYEYNMVIGLKESINFSENTGLIDIVMSDHRISDSMYMKEQTIDIGAGETSKSVSLIVPQDTKKMESFINLRIRTSGLKVPLTDDGVVLTEKLANTLHVGIGDEIYIKDGDTKRINVKVAGITENYVSHYVYMSPNLYETAYGEKVKFQELTAKITSTSEDFENKLSTDLIKNSDISSISFTTGISKNFNDIISSLNYIVLVLIISAGALAFVVLYNLTNINVTERLREIATIKVLGFYDKEVSAYVYRENVILTLIGMILGLVLGIFLHKFIVVTAEVDYVMFGRDIKPLSYLYSSLLTVFFSGLVNLIMHFKLKKISMVESLKSID